MIYLCYDGGLEIAPNFKLSSLNVSVRTEPEPLTYDQIQQPLLTTCSVSTLNPHPHLRGIASHLAQYRQ